MSNLKDDSCVELEAGTEICSLGPMVEADVEIAAGIAVELTAAVQVEETP